MVAKSSAALSVSVAYCMFHASYAATVTPRTRVHACRCPACMPMVRTTLSPSWPERRAVAANAISAAATRGGDQPSDDLHATPPRAGRKADHSRSARAAKCELDNFVHRKRDPRRRRSHQVPVEEALEPAVEVDLRPGAQEAVAPRWGR